MLIPVDVHVTAGVTDVTSNAVDSSYTSHYNVKIETAAISTVVIMIITLIAKGR